MEITTLDINVISGVICFLVFFSTWSASCIACGWFKDDWDIVRRGMTIATYVVFPILVATLTVFGWPYFVLSHFGFF